MPCRRYGFVKRIIRSGESDCMGAQSLVPIGYWAKLECGKRVKKEALPLSNPTWLRSRYREALGSLLRSAGLREPTVSIVEAPPLAGIRRAVSKARSDDEGFAAAQSRALSRSKLLRFPERGIPVLSQFFRSCGTQRNVPKAMEVGLVLIVESESIELDSMGQMAVKTDRVPAARARHCGRYSSSMLRAASSANGACCLTRPCSRITKSSQNEIVEW